MNKIIPVLGIILLAGLLALAVGFVPVGDPAPAPMIRQISAAAPGTGGAATLETIAKQGIVVDAATGTVLFAKDGAARMPTASMSKVMSLYMVFDALKAGRISLTDKFTTSERAWRMEGSKMFIQVGTQVSVEDLIRGVAIQSGNDAAVALAEGVAGSEDDFVKATNVRAKEIGMNNSNFTNASGWPDPNHYSTPQDLAILAFRMVNDFPQYYTYFGEHEFSYNNITQQNRDPLLGRLAGADGMKTGHTEEAGYGLIGSAQRDGRRVIMVLNGMDSMQSRADEGVRIMEWAFSNFELKTVYAAGQEVAQVPVWLGTAGSVAAVVEKDVKALLPRVGGGQIGVTLTVDAPIHAPVAKGDRLGTLTVELPGQAKQDIPVLAAADVARVGLLGRIGARLSNLVGGRDEQPEESREVPVVDQAAPAAVAPTPSPAFDTAPVAVQEAAPAEAPVPQEAPAQEAPATVE